MSEPQSYIDWQQKRGALPDFAARLCDILLDSDHKRLCEGRQYECSCGYDREVFEAAKQVRNLVERRDGWDTGLLDSEVQVPSAVQSASIGGLVPNSDVLLHAARYFVARCCSDARPDIREMALVLLSHVDDALALAAGTQSAETPSAAQSEGCQSGPKGNAQGEAA